MNIVNSDDSDENHLNDEFDSLNKGLGKNQRSQSLAVPHEDSGSIRAKETRSNKSARESSKSMPKKAKRPTIRIASEGSEEMEDEKKRNRRSVRRFGKEINPRSYQTGQRIRLVAMVAAVLIVPIQILAAGLVKPVEQALILRLQDLPEYCINKGDWCNVIISSGHELFERDSCLIVIYILLLVADSLLTFKTTLLTTLGIYFLSMLQLAFKDGRPFWDVADISSNGHCKLDFASPSEGAYLMTFFWPYIIIMYLFKYSPAPRYLLNLILIAALFSYWILNYYQGLINGLTYIY